MLTMTSRRSVLTRAAAFLLFLTLFPLAASGEESSGAESKPIRRYGLFIGANDGGPERARLVFAQSDSRAMVRVMEEVGGLAAGDAVVLADPSVAQVRRQLADIGERIGRERSQARRVEFLLYYSGHSDEEALMLGSDRLGYADLRDEVRDLGADISIAILDSCASGAFIRIKGGQRRPAFLVDESSAVQGQVYLTSSSESEASQESDSLGGSFFTHALIAALRGAADFSLDGKVTLHEAYQYASSETLARTENTQAGPQHPSWYINLNGTGDLVLTDLRSTSAGLTMSEELAGTVYIRDDRGKLIAEVRKSAGVPLTLALPPGSYTISSYSEKRTQEARIVLRDGKWGTLGASDFRDSSRVATRSRGDAEEPAPAPTDKERARELVQRLDEGDPGDFLSEVGTEVQDRVRRKVAQALERVQGESAAPEETTSPDASPELSRAGGGASPAAAPDREVVLVPFSIGFVPGLAFPYAGEARKVVSLNALIGVSYRIEGFEASGIMNITSHGVRGGQLAGIGNIVSGDVEGIQAAGIFSTVDGGATGFQSAGIFNTVKQGGSFVQAAGIFNLVEGRLRGVQLSGVFNGAPDLQGFQGAGVFSMAQGTVAGAQVSGIFNYAGTLRGVQVGLANVSSDAQGVQVGLVNFGGRTRGVQVGLVNISSSLRGLPIGLVNIVSDGLMLLSVSWDDRGFTGVEFASGTHLYTVLSGGVKLSGNGLPLAVSAQAGLGLHLTLGPFFLEGDLSARNAFGVPGGSSFVLADMIPFPSVRARAGLLLFGRIGGYVGYAVDAQLGQGIPTNTVAHTGTSASFTVWDQLITLYPRFTAGISVGRQPD